MVVELKAGLDVSPAFLFVQLTPVRFSTHLPKQYIGSTVPIILKRH
jgi:hypothetical protein